MSDCTIQTEPFAVLLGAGASVEAGLPTSNALTQKVLESFPEIGERRKVILKLYRTIVGALIFKEAQKGLNPTKVPINVERLAEALLLLADHRWSPFSELYGSLNPSILSIETEYKKSGWADDMKSGILSLLSADDKDKDRLAGSLSRTIAKQALDWPGIYKHGFNLLQEFCFRELRIKRGLTSRLNYLYPLVECSQVTSIATLNFDITIETVCERLKRPCDTGVFDSPRGHLSFKPGYLKLLKLHGSIDWCLNWDLNEDAEGHPVGVTVSRLSKGQPKFGGFGNYPCALFGTPNKLNARGPFLDLLKTFEDELEKVNRLVVIGYSFADTHINEVLHAWLGKNKENKIDVSNGPNWISSQEEYDDFWAGWQGATIDITNHSASEAIQKWCRTSE